MKRRGHACKSGKRPQTGRRERFKTTFICGGKGVLTTVRQRRKRSTAGIYQKAGGGAMNRSVIKAQNGGGSL